MHTVSNYKYHLENFDSLVKQFKSERSLVDRLVLKKALKNIIKELKRLNFENAEKLKQEFKGLTLNTKWQRFLALNSLEELEKNPQKWEPPPFHGTFGSDQHDLPYCASDLLIVATDEKKRHLLPKLLKKLEGNSYKECFWIDEPIFGFLLDKTVSTAYRVSSDAAYRNCVLLIKALDRTQKKIEQNEGVEALDYFKFFANRMREPLVNCARWAYPSHFPFAAREIATQMTNLSEMPLLIPIQSKNHTMGLLVEKTGEGKVRLILFNTGSRLLENHPRWKDSNRFQTFLVIEDVDSKPLTDPGVWKKLFALKDVDAIYDCFFSTLGQNRPISPPSIHEEDYEQKQFSRTCTAQYLMACIRHQIMVFFPGTVPEKRAVYKLIKSYVMQGIAGKKRDQVDRQVQGVFEKKLEKQEATQSLAKLANDEKAFEQVFEKLGAILKEETDLPFEANTYLARFELLRTYSKKVAEHWLREPDILDLSSFRADPDFNLALSIFENRLLTIRDLENELQRIEEKKDLGQLGDLLHRIIRHSSFTAVGERWIIQKLCPSSFDLHNEKDLEVLTVLCKELTTAYLIQLFERNERHELAAYLKEK